MTPILAVGAVAGLVWLGLGLYLVRLELRLRAVEAAPSLDADDEGAERETR